MDRATYNAASGGLVQLRKLEIANNNLANVNTPGFKKQVLTGAAQSFDQTLAKLMEGADPFARGDHERTPGAVTTGSATDFSAGAIRATGNPLDAALRNKNDFFVISAADGEQYTRAGNFTISPEGELVTMDGAPVLGDGGALNANGAGANIAPDGSLRVNGATAGKLRVVRFEDPTVLKRVGNSRFALPEGGDGPAQVDAQLEAGALEMSNVSSISSVLDLISATRSFDMVARSARTVDEMNGLAINQVGKRR